MAASARSVTNDPTAMAQQRSTQMPATTTQHAMALLADGVPLSLLLDLAGLTGATSREIMRCERDDTSWVPRRLSA